MGHHTPTRTCPHRWCRPLHIGCTALGVVALTQILVQSIIVAAILLALGFIAMGVTALTRGTTITGMVEEDSLACADEVLVERPAWARAAAAYDLLITVGGAAVVSVLFTGGMTAGELAPTGPDMQGAVVGAVLTIALGVFGSYAHWAATRPARPARQLDPVSGP
ncbi:hypothetical protein ACFRCG_39820 [Embleya sp. NPDC056575]|uniref:hypothetical protein n=1 Tax=unclassified Embleya TaxID=2699296 RepID=UPI0036B47ACF